MLIGPYSGIVDEHDQVRLGGYPGAFARPARRADRGVLPAAGRRVGRAGRRQRAAQVWWERGRATGAEVLASYVDGPVAGSPALTRQRARLVCRHPAGRRGSRPAAGAVCGEAGVAAAVPDPPPGLEVVRRSAPGRHRVPVPDQPRVRPTLPCSTPVGHRSAHRARARTGDGTCRCRWSGRGVLRQGGLMLAQQRQQAIHDMVQRQGGVRVADLVREFGVSDITIRRDLEALADRGLVAKVHGGAAPARPATRRDEPGFAAKLDRQRAEKEAIAARAARLVAPGTAIALSAGTTTCLLAAPLAGRTRADRADQLGSGRRRVLPRAAGGPDRRADRRHPYPVRRAGRSVRGQRHAVAQRRRALPRRTRDEHARRLHDTEPAGGRDEPGAGRDRAPSWWYWPTTRNGRPRASPRSLG